MDETSETSLPTIKFVRMPLMIVGLLDDLEKFVESALMRGRSYEQRFLPNLGRRIPFEEVLEKRVFAVRLFENCMLW